MKKQNKNLVIKTISIAIVFAGLSFYYYSHNISTPIDATNTEKVSFQIKKGAPIDQIAKDLKEKGLIKSPLSFKLYTKLNHQDTEILAGRFLLNKSMNIKEITNTLKDAKQSESVITIQEGLEIKDIDQKLVDLGLTQPGEFINEVKNFDGWNYYSFLDKENLKTLSLPLEGYIYPDTYFLDPADFSPHDLIYLALDNFEKKTEDLRPQIKNHSLNQILTMASIIEREVFGEKDRKLVSGILWKRLESGWMIGADATLLYITDDNKITGEDLAIESPYNTRKYAGLPPGPIGNPSIESIKAAMFPEESDYWFYLTTLDTGEVIYSKSNDEHNGNKAIYLN